MLYQSYTLEKPKSNLFNRKLPGSEGLQQKNQKDINGEKISYSGGVCY